MSHSGGVEKREEAWAREISEIKKVQGGMKDKLERAMFEF